MNVVGLDLSLTGTGVCHNGSVSTLKTKLKDEARLDFILTDLAGKFSWTPQVDLIVVEGLAFASQTGKATERAGLWWLVKMHFWALGIPVAVAPPTTIKKYATGKGNADKDTVMLAAAKLLPDFEISNNNEADAAILYAMAKDRLGSPVVTVPALNRQALDKVAWPEGF